MNISAARSINDTNADNGDTRAGLQFGTLEHSAGFVMRIAQLTVFERIFSVMPPDTIKMSEFTILLAVSENPGVRQGVLADVLKIKWPNMTKLVRELEDRGLLNRRVPPNDRRSVELHVTEAGQKEVEKASALFSRLDRMIFDMLDEDEHDQLLNLLRKILGWSAPADGERDEA